MKHPTEAAQGRVARVASHGTAESPVLPIGSVSKENVDES